MGCCSVTPITKGVDVVGPDEMELLEIGDGGLWTLGETKLSIKKDPDVSPQCSISVKQKEIICDIPNPVSVKESAIRRNSQVILWGWSKNELHQKLYTHPIRDWEGRAPHSYGDIIHSSLVMLHNGYTKVMSERYLVLFSFHLLILALDNLNNEFIYEGILPLSAIQIRVISQQDSSTLHMFEISGPMVDSKLFICSSAADRKCWTEKIEDRRCKSLRQQLSPSQSTLSYLLPCDESWKREELKRYLLRSPIMQWEGSPIQHMGQPVFLSLVHISNTQKQFIPNVCNGAGITKPIKLCAPHTVPTVNVMLTQGSQERLLVLFSLDILILSVDCQRIRVKYEGRLPRRSIRAAERSAQPGRLEFELTGQMMEPLLISCTYPEDYQCWIFQLQEPANMLQAFPSHTTPPLIPKKHRS